MDGYHTSISKSGGIIAEYTISCISRYTCLILMLCMIAIHPKENAKAITEKLRKEFGSRYIVIPNPSYGDLKEPFLNSII